MSDIKISNLAAKVSRNLLENIYPWEETIQLAINEACKPLVEALEKVTSGNTRSDCKGTHEDLRISILQGAFLSAQRTAEEAIAAHRKEHGE